MSYIGGRGGYLLTFDRFIDFSDNPKILSDIIYIELESWDQFFFDRWIHHKKKLLMIKLFLNQFSFPS